MCGIVGILLAPHAADPRRLAAIEAMAATLRHRGPDGGGIWMDRDAGAAHPEAARPGTTEGGGFTMPKFLMLARSDARAWEGVSAEEGQRIVKQYLDWSNRMRAAGRLAGSNKLKDGDARD